LKIDRANQLWSTDITYIPTARVFMYMTAYIEVYSRKIMGWAISDSMIKQWCLDVLEAAIAENGVPEIINSDRRSQYICPSWTNYLKGKGIKISIDEKGRATDNFWIERFWKTIKYNHINLNHCDTGLDYMKEFRPVSSTITRNNTKELA
jgi:putative transposase